MDRRKIKKVVRTSYKIQYTGNDRNENGARIIIDKSLKDEVMDISSRAVLLIQTIKFGVYRPDSGSYGDGLVIQFVRCPN